MAYFIDGKDCMVSIYPMLRNMRKKREKNHDGVYAVERRLTSERGVIDCRMDTPRLCVPVRRSAHLDACVQIAAEARLV